jgi:uracil phosphoribosyltransferase
MPLTLIKNPLIESQIGVFLDAKSCISECEQSLKLASLMMAAEMGHYIGFNKRSIQTITRKSEIATVPDNITLMPILRAGLPMADGFKIIFPLARVSHAIVNRSSLCEIAIDRIYYSNQMIADNIIILDSIIGTGLSIITVIDYLLSMGVPVNQIKVASLMATPQGIKAIENDNRDVSLFSCYSADILEEMSNTYPRQAHAGPRIFGV